MKLEKGGKWVVLYARCVMIVMSLGPDAALAFDPFPWENRPPTFHGPWVGRAKLIGARRTELWLGTFGGGGKGRRKGRMRLKHRKGVKVGIEAREKTTTAQASFHQLYRLNHTRFPHRTRLPTIRCERERERQRDTRSRSSLSFIHSFIHSFVPSYIWYSIA